MQNMAQHHATLSVSLWLNIANKDFKRLETAFEVNLSLQQPEWQYNYLTSKHFYVWERPSQSLTLNLIAILWWNLKTVEAELLCKDEMVKMSVVEHALFFMNEHTAAAFCLFL